MFASSGHLSEFAAAITHGPFELQLLRLSFFSAFARQNSNMPASLSKLVAFQGLGKIVYFSFGPSNADLSHVMQNVARDADACQLYCSASDRFDLIAVQSAFKVDVL